MNKIVNQLLKIASLAMLLLSFSNLSAQTEGSGIIVRVTVNGVSTDYYEGTCGYGTANWGGAFGPDALCAPVAWGYDITPDSIGCDSIPAGQLAGKIGMIRRGTCGFSVKAFYAQQAGAVAVLIAQLNNAPTTDDCFVQNMGATAPFATNTTVPVLFACRNMVNQIDAAIKAGQNPEICFVRPDVSMASIFFPVSHIQTPVGVIKTDTFGFGVNLTNLSETIARTNVKVTAKVLDITNNTELYTTTLTIPEIAVGVVDSFFQVPGTFVPALPLGTYAVRYTTSADPIGGNASVEDRKGGNFLVTTDLFANDNGATNGFRPGSVSGDWAAGSVYTIPAGTLENYQCSKVEFTFATNATDYAITAAGANLYLFKIDDDQVDADYNGFDDASFFSNSFQFKGFGEFAPDPTMVAYQLRQVTLDNIDNLGDPIPLVAGGRYFVVAEYKAPQNLTFHAFSTAVDLPGISTAVFNGTWFLGGFGAGTESVTRMYVDLASKTDEQPLPVNSMKIMPNPVVDVLNLVMEFDQPTDATITIADMNGRVITYENRKGLTNDRLQYPLTLASGTYLARIATKEGTLTKKFVVIAQ